MADEPPEFDPNQPFEEVPPESSSAAPEFDPNQPFEEVPAEAAAPAAAEPTSARDPNGQSQGRAALRGALQGASFGFADEGAALVGALMGGDPLLGADFSAPTIGERYAKARDYYRARNEAAEDAFPKTYLGSEFVGGMVAPGAKAAGAVSKLASRGERVAKLGKIGAATGGATALGHAEGDAEDQVGATVAGTLLGGVGTPALNEGARALAAPFTRLAQSLRRSLGPALSRVAGGSKANMRSVGGPERYAEAGLQGEAEGLINPWDVLPGRMGRQEARVAEYADKAFNDITQAIDDVGARVKVGPLAQALQGVASGMSQFPKTASSKLSGIANLVDDLMAAADPAGTVDGRTLQTAKRIIDDMISTWDPSARSKMAQDISKGLYHAVMEAQEQAVAAAPQGAGQAAYQTAKQASALAQRLEQFQAGFRAREGGNKLANLGGLENVIPLAFGIQQGFETGEWDRGLGAFLATRAITHPNQSALRLKLLSGAAGLPGRAANSQMTPLIARALMALQAGDAEGGELAQTVMEPRGEPGYYGEGTIGEGLGLAKRMRPQEPRQALR